MGVRGSPRWQRTCAPLEIFVARKFYTCILVEIWTTASSNKIKAFTSPNLLWVPGAGCFGQGLFNWPGPSYSMECCWLCLTLSRGLSRLSAPSCIFEVHAADSGDLERNLQEEHAEVSRWEFLVTLYLKHSMNNRERSFSFRYLDLVLPLLL